MSTRALTRHVINVTQLRLQKRSQCRKHASTPLGEAALLSPVPACTCQPIRHLLRRAGEQKEEEEEGPSASKAPDWLKKLFNRQIREMQGTIECFMRNEGSKRH